LLLGSKFCSRKCQQDDMKNLGDNYLRRLLATKMPFKSDDVPQELVELKRHQLKNRRTITNSITV
jgi:hypothetical protein